MVELCSRLVFGTGRLKTGDLRVAEQTVRRAYDLGIRQFDSSIGYGAGTAHAVLGSLIRSLPEGELFVSTKIGHLKRDTANFGQLYRSREGLWGLVHECCRTLGHIDLLQIHEADEEYWWSDPSGDGEATFVSPDRSYDFADSPIMATLERAKQAGVVRLTGITGNTTMALSHVAEHVSVDSVMCAYNLDPVFRGGSNRVAHVAHRRNMMFMAAGVLQGGLYRRPLDLPTNYAALPGVAESFRRFDRIQRESGLSAVELVFRWMHSVPGVDRWVFGASRPEQVEETMRILSDGPLPDDLRRNLDSLAVDDLDWRMVTLPPA